MARSPLFEQISPEVAALDEEALADAMAVDPDATLALLAELTRATDVRLRMLARSLAARLFVELGRCGPGRGAGVGRLQTRPFRDDGSDLDLDASLEGLLAAGRHGRQRHPVDVAELRVRAWQRPDLAVCLVVDRSGSMGGQPLATAALAAAAVAWRVTTERSVLAFAKDVIAVCGHGTNRPAALVVDDLLALRGVGTTDLGGALLAAGQQLSTSRAGRRLTVLLSDCRSTVDGDPVGSAAALDELVIVAPESDHVEAAAFAAATGARLVTIGGPSTVVAAISAAMERRSG